MSFLATKSTLKTKVRESCFTYRQYRRLIAVLEWDDAYAALAKTLGLGSDALIPPIPRPPPTALNVAMAEGQPRKALTADGESMAVDGDEAANEQRTPHVINQLPPLLSVLQPSDVAQPVLPTKAELESVLLDLRKRALLEEYVGESVKA
jgi:pre-mRNA-splicing factor ISY1